MKFGNINFQFGKATIDISGLNSEEATGRLSIKFPLEKMVFELIVFSGQNWKTERGLNIELNVHEIKPPEPETESDGDVWGDDEHDEDEDDDA